MGKDVQGFVAVDRIPGRLGVLGVVAGCSAACGVLDLAGLGDSAGAASSLDSVDCG